MNRGNLGQMKIERKSKTHRPIIPPRFVIFAACFAPFVSINLLWTWLMFPLPLEEKEVNVVLRL